mmetsp:Transcript_42141/g.63660  ORF Transcript_42141/g.63660 Transcript_42141/m.63660 type:complete len:159 (-) Transcript_42141:80-556(-)
MRGERGLHLAFAAESKTGSSLKGGVVLASSVINRSFSIQGGRPSASGGAMATHQPTTAGSRSGPPNPGCVGISPKTMCVEQSKDEEINQGWQGANGNEASTCLQVELKRKEKKKKEGLRCPDSDLETRITQGVTLTSLFCWGAGNSCRAHARAMTTDS